MHELQENVKKKLQEIARKYRQRTYLRRREVNFQFGDLVMAYIRKERFPKGTYNKLKLKRIGPCKILRKFSTNAYEIELPSNLQIFPIFNVSDIYRFRDSGVQIEYMISGEYGSFIDWKGHLPHKG